MMRKTILLLIAILAITAPAFAAEMLTNGGFQMDTPVTGKIAATAAPTGWTYYTAVCDTAKDGNGLGSNYSTASGDIQEGASTTLGYNMTAINATQFYYMSARGGNTSGGCNGIYQTVNLSAGTYTLTGTLATLNMGMTIGANDWYAWEVGMIAGEWNTVPPLYGTSSQRVPEIGSLSDTYGIWGSKNAEAIGTAINLDSTNVLSGRSNVLTLDAGTYTFYIQAATNYNPSATNKARFKLMADNMSLTGDAVPEPGSMVAMFSGLIGLVGYGIRRKK